MFTKFGTVTDSDLLWTGALSNRNRKLIRDVNGRRLENFNYVITMSPMVQYSKLVRWHIKPPFDVIFTEQYFYQKLLESDNDY